MVYIQPNVLSTYPIKPKPTNDKRYHIGTNMFGTYQTRCTYVVNNTAATTNGVTLTLLKLYNQNDEMFLMCIKMEEQDVR
jgi:hypothetical protein